MENRGVSPVISVILMLAIVVILAAVLSAFVLDSTESLDDPAPNVADTTGEFQLEKSGQYTLDDQLVRITHLGGDNVLVEEMEIIVRASGPDVDTEARLINLPGNGRKLADENIQAGKGTSETEAEDLISQGTLSPPDQVIVNEDIWSAGYTIQFRITTTEADFREGESPDADTLEVVIVHTPSNSILSEHMFTP